MVRIRVKNSKVIGLPVRQVYQFRQVYQYLADFSLHGEWDNDAKEYLGTPGVV